LKFLPVNQLSLLTVILILLIAGCNSNPGPGGDATKVSFNTEDGIQLSGHLFGSGDVGIVLSHMRHADQESWWSFARVLKNKGYQIIAYDFRGYRDSLGEIDIGNIDKDVQAAVDFLKSKGVSKLFLIGAHMGGTASLKVASKEDIAGVVTLSAPPIIDVLDIGEDIRLISSPKLFMASRDDVFYSRSVDLFDQKASAPKERWIVDGNAHGTNMLSGDSGPRVQGLIVDFLRRYSE